MIARLIIDGILHSVQIRKDSNKSKSVARVHNLSGEPVALLKEVGKNKFIDEVEHKVYQLNPMTRVVVGC